jgi:hypothetical protein
VGIFLDLFFLITKLLRCYCLGGGTVAITAVAFSFFNSRGKSTHIADRCVDRCTWSKRPGPSLLISYVYRSRVARETAVGPVCRRTCCEQFPISNLLGCWYEVPNGVLVIRNNTESRAGGLIIICIIIFNRHRHFLLAKNTSHVRCHPSPL